ncbi:MAG: hypothetical protein ABIR62_11650 [Dokdonella sp.]|uniref:hypothetical protein n=1 Tax=Dokdonella sp. TaxID=2291710 RepID=UPI0032633FB8
MRAMFPILFALCAITSSACAAERWHYIELVNTAPESITSFSIAAVGSTDFREVRLGVLPLHGGGDSATIGIDGDGCMRDFRTVFNNGRTLIQQKFNVCKYRSYHTGQYLRARAPAAAYVKS